MLESSTGWVEKSQTSSKMVLNPSYWLHGVLIIQIFYLDLFFDLFWTIFGLRRPKNVQNVFFKIVDFLLLFHGIEWYVLRYITDIFACLITFCDSLGYSKVIFYIWIYFWTYFGAIFWLRMPIHGWFFFKAWFSSTLGYY